MNVIRKKAEPETKGAQYFTGSVQSVPMFRESGPSRVRGSTVTFQPGARSAWHTHPISQTLIVTAGRGRVQTWGGPVEQVGPGDVIQFGPGEKHWHGAGPDSTFTHITILEVLDGKGVDWMEHVTDEQYSA